MEKDYENKINYETNIGGVIIEHIDNHYVVKNPSYSQNINANGNAYIQILANIDNIEAEMTNIVLYLGGENYPAYTFNVPNSSGRYWDVFTYNASTKTIIPINEMRQLYAK